ncbi:MAG: hypothetical protein V4689_03865 [Verrucomicrobiota bacterium]
MTRFCILAALLLAASPVFAISPKDLVGDWSGRHEETVKGKSETISVRLEGSKTTGGGFQLVEYASSLSITATYVFKKDGKFSCKTVQYGMYVLSSYSGRWQTSSGKLVISADGRDGRLLGSVVETEKGFKFTGNASKSKIVITAKRG